MIKWITAFLFFFVTANETLSFLTIGGFFYTSYSFNEVTQFQRQRNYNLRKYSTCRILTFSAIFKGKLNVVYLDPKNLSQIPEDIRS